MSQQNVEIARRLVLAVTERDIETVLELTDPAVEWESTLGVIAEAGTYHGHEGVRQWARDLEDAFEVFEATLDGAITQGDVLVGVGTVTFRGSTSGIEQTAAFGWTVHFQDGKISYMKAFRDPEQVLRAVGLSE